MRTHYVVAHLKVAGEPDNGMIPVYNGLTDKDGLGVIVEIDESVIKDEFLEEESKKK